MVKFIIATMKSLMSHKIVFQSLYNVQSIQTQRKDEVTEKKNWLYKLLLYTNYKMTTKIVIVQEKNCENVGN